jgi:ATP-dependent protease ClpP protease subunit
MPNWSEILSEIQKEIEAGHKKSRAAFDQIRRKYLKKLQNKTDRNVICYYSAFLTKPQVFGTDLTDDDKNAFMMTIHQLDRSKGLDLFLHTPGGSVAAAESIVDYLHQMFGNDIRAIVPQIAMSAGTMLACSCKSIVMGTHSNLGPIDPQINGIPAQGVLDEVKTAHAEIVADQSKLVIWQFILGKYDPTFVGQCQQAIDWSKDFVGRELKSNMLSGDPDVGAKALKIVERLSDYSKNKAHNRHIHLKDCEDLGLKIERLESDRELQDLVLTVHHCFMHTLSNTSAVKIVENHLGAAQIRSMNVPAKVNQP